LNWLEFFFFFFSSLRIGRGGIQDPSYCSSSSSSLSYFTLVGMWGNLSLPKHGSTPLYMHFKKGSRIFLHVRINPLYFPDQAKIKLKKKCSFHEQPHLNECTQIHLVKYTQTKVYNVEWSEKNDNKWLNNSMHSFIYGKQKEICLSISTCN
jgi:hypothetical protein